MPVLSLGILALIVRLLYLWAALGNLGLDKFWNYAPDTNTYWQSHSISLVATLWEITLSSELGLATALFLLGCRFCLALLLWQEFFSAFCSAHWLPLSYSCLR